MATVRNGVPEELLLRRTLGRAVAPRLSYVILNVMALANRPPDTDAWSTSRIDLHTARTFVEAVTQLRPGDHLCLIYETTEEQLATVVPFMRLGLERRERCLYIFDENTEQTVLEALRAGGVAVEKALASGALSVVGKRETYVREGRFDPDLMIELLARSTAEARAAGFSALRASGEMTWALAGETGSERLIEYEAKLNRFLPGSDCLAICQYNRNRFSAEVIRDVIRTHPLVIVGRTVYRNPFFVPPDELLAPSPEKEVNRLLGQLVEAAKIEAELYRSERKFATLFDKSLHPVALTTCPDGILVEVNEAFERTFGFSKGEALGRSFFELGINRDSQCRAQLLTRLKQCGSASIPEITLYTKAGEPRLFSLNLDLVEIGGTSYNLVTAEDITERRRVEQSLREAQRRYQEAERVAHLGNWEWNIVTNELWWSEGIYRIFGLQPEEFGATYEAFLATVHPEDRGRVMAAVDAALYQGASYDIDHRIVRPDGTVRTVHERAEVLRDDEGKAIRMVGSVQDVTEARQLEGQLHQREEELRQAQKLDAIGQLAGGVAHDFNNILQAIAGLTGLLKLRADSPEVLATTVEELEEHVRQATALTRQLLLFSRREVTKLEYVELCELVSGMAKMLRRLLPENIQLSVDVCPDPCTVYADRGQIEQVLMNLALNARDAMPDGGTLTIRTNKAAEGWAWFEVKDTGCGMTDEVKAHLFEPFFTTKPAGRGTGLGLAVVHGIVTSHGGRIEVESAPGMGSTFRVYLPLAQKEAPRTHPQTAARALESGHGERILLVEDEEGVRQALADVLESLGYQVVAVGSAEEAFALPEDSTFDLLLTDLVLPGLSGVELAIGLQSRWPDLRLLLMSGHTEDQVAKYAVFTGRVRFLQKPFDLATLARELRNALA